ncbi:MAG: hypothetical protein SFY67_11260 [Candidatus Melainabacteria bacterium]|nr:hypothetical protein [Candidatus Melainabacteria bacterium]
MKVANSITKVTSVLLLTVIAAAPALALDAKLISPHQVARGEEVHICVKTEAAADCELKAPSLGLGQALKLLDCKANKNGKAFWSFQVPADYKQNRIPLAVTVKKNGQERKQISAINIVNR